MIEPRVYRAAFLPALLAAAVAMFSLESRPRPLPQGLAADVLFDGDLAAQSARELARRHPDRRAGTAGDRAVAGAVADELERRRFRVETLRFEEAGKELIDVVGRRAGRSRRQVVVVAARDAGRVPDATAGAGDTAALLELARVLEGRPSRKTLVLASVDGSLLGAAGSERLAEALGDPALVDGVLVISNLAAARRGDSIVPWSLDSRRPGIALERTVADSLRQEVGGAGGAAGAGGQLVRLAFPIGIGPQAVLLERGFDAVRISGSGELPPGGSGLPGEVDPKRLGGLGRATLRAVTALDQGPRPEGGPGSYLIAVTQVVPGWVLSLLAASLLLPALVAAVDAFARARRRREPVGAWLAWFAISTAPFVAGLALAELLGLLGAVPEASGAPAPPDQHPLDAAAAAVMAGVVAVAVLAWWAPRRLLLARRPALGHPSRSGAGVVVALVTCAAVLVLWVVNPYAALLMAPAAHLWMLAALFEPPAGARSPRRPRALLVALGLVAPAAAAAYYLVALSIDPLSGVWYLLLLVTGGSVGLVTALIGCVLLGCLLAVSALARAGRSESAPPAGERPAVYGPGAYAGPGSLGGTESALKR